jgi:hypothetical protein
MYRKALIDSVRQQLQQILTHSWLSMTPHVNNIENSVSAQCESNTAIINDSRRLSKCYVLTQNEVDYRMKWHLVS